MGQSINPISLRLGVSKTWKNRFFNAKITNQLPYNELQQFLKSFFFNLIFQKLQIFYHSAVFCLHEVEPTLIVFVHWYAIDENPLSFETRIVTQSVFSYFIEKNLYCFFTSRNLFYKVRVVFLDNPSADTLFFLVKSRLKWRFRPKQLMVGIKKYLKYCGFSGCKLVFSGRFSRKQMATQEMFSYGSVPLSTLSKTTFIDYSFGFVKLRNGICGVKIWLCQKNL